MCIRDSSAAALAAVLGDAVLDAPGVYTPDCLKDVALTHLPVAGIEETANGVFHPITKETITSYAKLVADPLLWPVWTKAMCKELGRLAQGYGKTKGTNTIEFYRWTKYQIFLTIVW